IGEGRSHPPLPRRGSAEPRSPAAPQVLCSSVLFSCTLEPSIGSQAQREEGMVRVSEHIQLDEQELEFMAIRAQGAGGQNVNKVSSAIHLRFDIRASSLLEHCKERLLQYRDHRISKDGVIVIKAQRHRTQEQNREDAIARLVELIQARSAERRVGQGVMSLM